MKTKLLLFAGLLSLIAYAQEYSGPPEDLEQIINTSKLFSEAVIKSDYNAIAGYYTEDAKIFPNDQDIIAGTEEIKKYWTLPEGASVPEHSTESYEIKVMGDDAYDYGYYQGKSKNKQGVVTPFKGKYVIVWKKINGVWKIYIDIWNRIKD